MELIHKRGCHLPWAVGEKTDETLALHAAAQHVGCCSGCTADCLPRRSDEAARPSRWAATCFPTRAAGKARGWPSCVAPRQRIVMVSSGLRWLHYVSRTTQVAGLGAATHAQHACTVRRWGLQAAQQARLLSAEGPVTPGPSTRTARCSASYWLHARGRGVDWPKRESAHLQAEVVDASELSSRQETLITLTLHLFAQSLSPLASQCPGLPGSACPAAVFVG